MKKSNEIEEFDSFLRDHNEATDVSSGIDSVFAKFPIGLVADDVWNAGDERGLRPSEVKAEDGVVYVHWSER